MMKHSMFAYVFNRHEEIYIINSNSTSYMSFFQPNPWEIYGTNVSNGQINVISKKCIPLLKRKVPIRDNHRHFHQIVFSDKITNHVL